MTASYTESEFELRPTQPAQPNPPNARHPSHAMRLTPSQTQTIRDAVHEHAGGSAMVRLFGSRVDNTADGGDVDLLIEARARIPLADEIRIAAASEQRLGMPVDVLTTWSGDKSRPIVELARLTGIEL